MNRRYRDFLRIRGQNLRDTFKIMFNLSVHVILRAGLWVRFRNRSEVIRYIEGHPEVYWTRFPFDLSGTILLGIDPAGLDQDRRRGGRV